MKKSRRVSESAGPAARTLGEKLARTFLEHGGVGLAAPQVSVFKRVMVTRGFVEPWSWNLRDEFRVFINPSHEEIAPEGFAVEPEACLSVPEGAVMIQRAKKILARWFEVSGPSQVLVQETRYLEGLEARVFLHELDHLDGVSIIQRYESQR
jgi:peptide deformylase